MMGLNACDLLISHESLCPYRAAMSGSQPADG
uniref:Uncharacterized protein n=1 Tax=Anguilla anguilla TaxID=7936 RepID=A0A0E9S240_ANGAN